MALSVTEMNAASTPYYGKRFEQQAYDSIDFLKYLVKNDKKTVRGGTSITWPIRYKKLDRAQAVSWGDQEDFTDEPTITQAELDWAPYRVSTMIGWEKRQKNRGKQEIVNLAESKAKELLQDLKDLIDADLWASSAVTGHIAPLSQIVDSADTYGGIAVADAANWAATEDSSSTQMTRALFHSNVRAVQWGEYGPNRYYTTRAIAAYYDTLLTGDERYVNTSEMNTGPKVATLYGDPVVIDPNIPSGDFYGLDMDAFELVVMEGDDFWTSDWEDLFVGGYPKSMAKVATFVANLVCYRRRTNFKLTALTGT